MANGSFEGLYTFGEAAKIYGLDDSLVRYRIHTNGRSFNKVNSAKFRWKIYREYLKLDIFNSIIYFSFYFFNGIIKYRWIRRIFILWNYS